MIYIPKFKRHLRVELVPPDIVFIFNEDRHRAFQSKFVYSLISEIDGNSTSSEIKRRLRGCMKETDVETGLLFLESEGLIVDAHEALPPEIDALSDYFQIDARAAERRLKKTRVAVSAIGDVHPESLMSILESIGIRTDDDGNFAVVLVDDYLQEELREWNRIAIKNKKRWMLAKPTSSIFWIGPVFGGSNPACWNCLALRLNENRRAGRFIEANRKTTFKEGSNVTLSSTIDAALNLIANEILKQVIGVPMRSELITCDMREMQIERHAVLRLDHCSECQNGKVKSKRLVLKSRKKIFTPPEITYERFRRHISPITGIIESITPYGTKKDDMVHSYIAGHIFLPRLQAEDVFRRGLVQQSGGKGMTEQEAKTSALCEALERYSGMFRGNESRKTAAAKDLGGMAVLPNSCMNFSERQYAIRAKWNRTHHNHDWVPMPFDEAREIEWTPVWSLTKARTRYVPTAYCYYGYPLPADHQFCRADSNGNAAGNSIEEAIVHGFLELIERDATAIWWFNRMIRPAVDLDSFSLPYIESLQKHFRKLGREFWVLDLTTDYPIPAFVALSNLCRNSGKQFLVGFGAHFDPVVALVRALTEMNQFLPGISAGNTNGILQPAADNLQFLFPDREIPAKKRNDYPRYESKNDFADIQICVRLAAERGMETLVQDQTRGDVGIPVAKVIVPGMRQFWVRLGKGRLYDVPVKLGWLKKPQSESQLNQERIVI